MKQKRFKVKTSSERFIWGAKFKRSVLAVKFSCGRSGKNWAGFFRGGEQVKAGALKYSKREESWEDFVNVLSAESSAGEIVEQYGARDVDVIGFDSVPRLGNRAADRIANHARLVENQEI
ncbi:hypothetical protein L1049_013430 [Liquidambar formosana]|uniref:Uncharacterized protein n=1 Tax=Liquidambar formosana TaxID=63359 RepID=A0AAP0RLV7_LIQFO